MKKLLTSLTFLSLPVLALANTHGTSSDNVFLLLVPLAILILILASSWINRTIRQKLAEYRERKLLEQQMQDDNELDDLSDSINEVSII